MVLVLGGAGYLGSHAVKMLRESGEEVVVIDNLITGHRASVPSDILFHEIDIRDITSLDQFFKSNEIESIMFFSASSLVGESVEDPLKYYDNNVLGTINVLKCIKKYGVKYVIFSSSAAVYGEPKSVPITEQAEKSPKSPYGETKSMMEDMFKSCSKAYGFKYVSLRYFNVAGADKSGEIGEDHRPETHLIPNVLKGALNPNFKLQIFGGDYPTKDGTNIRDYIHILDLIDAHILALKFLRNGGESDVFNLGSGDGYSNLEIISAARKITATEIPYEIVERRAGDPNVLIASSDKAKRVLGWRPRFENIETIVGDAWNWHKNNPDGYKD